jgi:hypothetical protein
MTVQHMAQDSAGIVDVAGAQLRYRIEGHRHPCLVAESAIFYPPMFSQEPPAAVGSQFGSQVFAGKSGEVPQAHEPMPVLVGDLTCPEGRGRRSDARPHFAPELGNAPEISVRVPDRCRCGPSTGDDCPTLLTRPRNPPCVVELSGLEVITGQSTSWPPGRRSMCQSPQNRAWCLAA